MYELSRLALRDLDGILEYTLLEHGLDQAERYVDSLKRAFTTLAENPHLSRERTEFRPPVHIHPHEHHLIVYVRQGAGIFIVRVLHESMDVPGNLSD